MSKVGISFGICLSPEYNSEHLLNLINSIHKQSTSIDYEILIVGKYRNDVDLPCPIKYIEFDETIKRAWITKKKNVLVSNSMYDNLCILHDYYILNDDWIDGFVKFNSENRDWKIMMNKILRKEGDRHSDWLINQKYMDEVISNNLNLIPDLMSSAPEEVNGPRWVCGLPYDETQLRHLQYVSGGYIVAKKDILLETPLDERYGWGEAAEDIIWSEAVISKGHRFSFNPYSTTSIQKAGKWRVYQMTDACLQSLKELFGTDAAQ